MSVRILKHGTEHEKQIERYVGHVYRCPKCSCEFVTSHDHMQYMLVGHGMCDYVTNCPECGDTIYEILHKIGEAYEDA